MASTPFECPFCFKRFQSEDFLNKHMQGHNGMEYKCRACPEGYSTQNALNGHMRVHKEKKQASSPAAPLQITFLPYKCRACANGYPTQNALNAHQRSHKEKKEASGQFKCRPPCNKSFRRQYALNGHMRKHKGKGVAGSSAFPMSPEPGSSPEGSHAITPSIKKRPRITSSDSSAPKKRRRITSVGLNEPRTEEEDCKNDDNKAGAWLCRVCGDQFTNQNDLNGHKEGHKGKKPASSPPVPPQNTFLEPRSSSASTLPPKERPCTSILNFNKPPTEKDKNNDDNNAGAGVKIQKNDSAGVRGSEIDLNEAPEAGPVKPPKKQFDLNELPPKDDEETDDNAGAGFGA